MFCSQNLAFHSQPSFLQLKQTTLFYRFQEDEAKQKEKWLKDVTLVLIGNGRKSFMKTLSRCLVSGIQGLVRTCLVTAAWMSHALVLLSASHQIPSAVFSDFIPQLKQRLEEDDQIEHRILASISLLNLSKVSGEQN